MICSRGGTIGTFFCVCVYVRAVSFFLHNAPELKCDTYCILACLIWVLYLVDCLIDGVSGNRGRNFVCARSRGRIVGAILLCCPIERVIAIDVFFRVCTYECADRLSSTGCFGAGVCYLLTHTVSHEGDKISHPLGRTFPADSLEHGRVPRHIYGKHLDDLSPKHQIWLRVPGLDLEIIGS